MPRFDKSTVVSWPVLKWEKLIPGFIFVGPIVFTVCSSVCALPSKLCARALAPSFSTWFNLKLKLISEVLRRKKCAKNMAPTTSMPYIPLLANSTAASFESSVHGIPTWLARGDRSKTCMEFIRSARSGMPLQNSRFRYFFFIALMSFQPNAAFRRLPRKSRWVMLSTERTRDSIACSLNPIPSRPGPGLWLPLRSIFSNCIGVKPKDRFSPEDISAGCEAAVDAPR
mmetsp:Transcript_32129/g.75089  ORF Transcript_32129/g.75089 Transcript_32129/m.75089 type:complete len:227 (-) Transcript_32129:131-811(-)